jgi:DNA mismatch repair ATPase MutS
MTDYYHSRIKETEIVISRLQKKDNYFYTARLASFLLFLLFLILSISSGNSILIVSTIVLLIAFTRIVLLHLKNHALLTRELTRKELLENEIECLHHQPNAYSDGEYFADANHDFSPDMDVFGKGGLFHFINRCATGVGNKALAKWLAHESPLDAIMQRQSAISEISKLPEWSEELRVGLYRRRISDFGKEHLPNINRTVPEPKNLKLWITVSYGILALTLAAILIGGIGSVILLVPATFNMILNLRMGAFTKTIRAQLDGREKTLNDYRRILTAFEEKKFNSTCLIQMQQELNHEKTNATTAIEKLQELSKKLDYSLNMLVGVILNLFFIWDIIICRKITHWFDVYAPMTEKWFDVAGRLEALLSLANIRNNFPSWNFPTFKNEKFTLDGKNLGHPLIPEKERVCNDYTLEETTFLNIVTGSNMAGKSTFLRTIGVNIILAKSGAPVCADELILSHFRIMTYLTITDSLAENTSTFYREIKRLKKILDSARKDNNVLLLLDELLRGTNSADKAKGSMAVVKELIKYNVPAIIATHNLELAEMKSRYPQEIENYYFDIIIDKENKMRFDYKLKHGVCNTFNASLLLKEIGIDIND